MTPTDDTAPCVNCGADDAEAVVSVALASEAALVASDGGLIDAHRAVRRVCGSCGVLIASFDPPDAVRRRYDAAYDLSATVQNNLVVVDGAVTTKKSRIETALDTALAERGLSEARVLEVACGEGTLARRLASTHPRWRVIGVDPSETLVPNLTPARGEPTLIRAGFAPELFGDETFDVIIAHGFLNRVAPLPALKAMRALAAPGALVSLEHLYLDTSVQAPRIWDHTAHMTRSTMGRWLQAVGLRPTYERNNVSSWHLIAEAVAPRTIGLAEPGVAHAASAAFHAHETWWREAELAALAFSLEIDTPIALYGAGMFSAALMAAAPSLDPAAIIDDAKAGGAFHTRPVISVEAAAARGLTALVFSRPDYTPTMMARAAEAGLTAIDITPPAPNLGPSPRGRDARRSEPRSR